MTGTITMGQAVIALLLLFIAAVGGLFAWRRGYSEVQKDTIDALEKRLLVLEKEVEFKTRELFDGAIRIKDNERNNERLGRTNLDQQRQIDSIRRHERRMEKAMKDAGLKVPEPDGEEEEWG